METLSIDPNELTLGEVAWLEEYVGKTVDDIFNVTPGAPPKSVPMRAAIGLVYIFRKRENPAFTVADAEAVKLTDLNDLEISGPDPTPSGNGTSSSPAVPLSVTSGE